MADNIVQGLFGITPEAYQAQRDQAAQQQALQFAGLDPFQRAAYSTFLGANQLGGAIGGALGAQDPQLQLISRQQELLKTVNPNNPDSLAKAAQEAATFSPQLALALSNQATALMGKMTTQAKESAAAEASLASAKKSGFDIASEENARVTARAALKAQNVPESQIEAIVANKEARDSYLKQVQEKTQTVEADGRVFLIDKASGKKIADLGTAPQRGTSLNVQNVQEKGINKNKVDLAGTVEQAALTAPDRMQMASSVRGLIGKSFTGFGADAILKAAQVLEAAGIGVKGTSESEQLDQLLNEMTIGAAGSLKGALSDKDREFVKQTIGTRGLTKGTLEYVADELERRARVDEVLNNEVNAYKGNLNDFNFAEARSKAVKTVNERQAKEKRLRELERRAAGGK